MAGRKPKTVKKTAPKKVKEKVVETVIENPQEEQVMETIEEEVLEPITETVEEEEITLDGDSVVEDENPILEVANGDPSVLTPKEEEVVKEEIKENKQTRVVGDPFNYSWNGQEIDF